MRGVAVGPGVAVGCAVLHSYFYDSSIKDELIVPYSIVHRFYILYLGSGQCKVYCARFREDEKHRQSLQLSDIW